MLDPQLIQALRAQLGALEAQFHSVGAELERAREARDRRKSCQPARPEAEEAEG